MKRSLQLCACLSVLVIAAGCEATKSSTPLSPTIAGPIPGVGITPPLIVEPKDNISISSDQQPVTLTIQNAQSSGVRPLTYTFEVASDTDFTNKVFARDSVAPGD